MTTPGSPQTRKQHVIFWLIFVVLMVLTVSRFPGASLSRGGIALRVGILLIMTSTASYVNLGILILMLFVPEQIGASPRVGLARYPRCFLCDLCDEKAPSYGTLRVSLLATH